MVVKSTVGKQRVNMMSDESKLEIQPLILETKNENASNTTSKEQMLKKSLGCLDIFVYVVSTIIGSGIYVSPALVARYTSNMGISLII